VSGAVRRTENFAPAGGAERVGGCLRTAAVAEIRALRIVASLVLPAWIPYPLRVTLPQHARPGKTTVRLRPKYQPCDDRVCLAPATLAIPLEVSFRPPSGPVESKP